MTTTIQSKSDILTALHTAHKASINTITQMDNDNLFRTSETRWSSADYVKHLIMSVKPFAKGLLLPPEQLGQMFGTTDEGSMSYAELVDKYEAKMATGFGAEDTGIVPVNYRMPEGVTDEKAYLIETWDEANQRLFKALENWTEADLDTYQLPHPAIGNITIREMLFFTIHHNELHHEDIKAFVTD